MISPPGLVCTALVFAYLTGPAADMRETWGPVAEKSRKWLAKITKTSAPKVGEETPASWASTVTLNPSLKGLGNAGSSRFDARWNAEISRLIAFCIERRNPWALGNVTPKDVCYGRSESILACRETLKRDTLSRRRVINQQPQGSDGAKPYLTKGLDICHSL